TLVDTDRFMTDFPGSSRLPEINTGINSVRPLIGHLPEWILDNSRCVHSHPDFQKQNFACRMGLQKLRIPVRRSVPPFILHKGIITPEVHSHGSAADRTERN